MDGDSVNKLYDRLFYLILFGAVIAAIAITHYDTYALGNFRTLEPTLDINGNPLTETE